MWPSPKGCGRPGGLGVFPQFSPIIRELMTLVRIAEADPIDNILRLNDRKDRSSNPWGGLYGSR
jgi:hypothetical protein